MKRYIKSSVSALAMSALVFGGVVVASVSLVSGPAFAKNDNANNGNNDRGNSNDNRGNNGNGNSKSNGNGATASSLGALNAAHANENAFLNASDNSRVGLIRAYETAVYATFDAQADLDGAVEAYDLALATRDGAAKALTDAEAALAAEELLAVADATYIVDPSFAAAVTSAQIALTDAETALGLASGEIELAEAAVTAAQDVEDTALEAAANKDITEEAITALWDLLEITEP